MSTNPTEVEVTTLENEQLDAQLVNSIAHDIELQLMGKDMQASVAALIALAIVNMRDGFETGDLAQGVYDVSQFIMTLPDAADGVSAATEGVS